MSIQAILHYAKMKIQRKKVTCSFIYLLVEMYEQNGLSNQIYCWLDKFIINLMIKSQNKKTLQPKRSQSQSKFANIYSTYIKREQNPKNYKVVAYNRNIFQSISKIKNHRVSSDSKNINGFHPQLQKKTLESVYRVNKSRSLKELLEMKLRFQEQRIKELKKQSQIRQKEIQKNRKQQTGRKMREYQVEKKQADRKRQIQKSWRQKTLQRQKTQTSFILQTRRESTAMKRRASVTSNKSQRSLVDQKFRQNLRSSKFQEQKRKLQRQKQQYQLQYRLSFLKNKSAPKQKLSDDKLYSTLKQKSKKLTEIYSQTQHLPIISQRKSTSTLQKNSKTKQAKLEKELVISSIVPKEQDSKNKKIKPINPQLQHQPIQAKEEEVKLPNITTSQLIKDKEYIEATHSQPNNQQPPNPPLKQQANQLQNYLQGQIKQ